jgi:transposase
MRKSFQQLQENLNFDRVMEFLDERFQQFPEHRASNARARFGECFEICFCGSIDGETMLFFVEDLLAPTLKRGEIVVFDNCPIHKQEEIEEAIEAFGASVLFLPPYSPDMNPIENCWSKVKAFLRALKPRTFDALLDALVEAFASITVQDIQGWFGHCGYHDART